MQTGKFIKNAAALTVTALILRSIGMVFRIWLSAAVGEEGMGLYQLIISVYVLASTFATSGICTAVTRLIAEELECGGEKSVRRILRRSVLLSLIVAAVSTAAVFLLADGIAVYWIKDARAALSLRILSLSLPFMGVSSCIRGYFIARRRVAVQSTAQIFEQLVRISLIMLIIGRFAPLGIGCACAAVLIGDTVAEACACVYMYIGYLRDKKRAADGAAVGRSSPPYSVVGRIVSISLPITAGRYLTTALRTAENLLVPQKLAAAGGSYDGALAAFGRLKGMALPILFFPGSFLSALSTLMVPEMSAAAASGDREGIRSAAKKTICITSELSMLIAGVFLVFSREIGVAVYRSEEVGVLLRCLAPLVPLMYLESVTDGILKGLDQQNSLFWYNVADSAVRIGLIYAIVPMSGMSGFLTVMVVSNVLTSTLCVGRLLRTAGMGIDAVGWFVRPAVCAAVSCASAGGVMRFIAAPDVVILVLGALIAAAVYLLTMRASGGFVEFSFVRSAAAKKRARSETRLRQAADRR